MLEPCATSKAPSGVFPSTETEEMQRRLSYDYPAQNSSPWSRSWWSKPFQNFGAVSKALQALAEQMTSAADPAESKDGAEIKTRKLGPVGGRIVAETFAGILPGGSGSYAAQNPLWKPTTLAINGVFGLGKLMLTALKG